MEHTYWASREVGDFYETEPLIGNYALAYALGLCHAPYNWDGPPRYKQDLGPLNEQGWYVTPGTFAPGKLRYAVSQYNSLSDSYYFRFDNNAIATIPLEQTGGRKSRATNFPQSGKIRLLGLGSQAHFFLISQERLLFALPPYIRLGKFNSKARLEWEELKLLSNQPKAKTSQEVNFLLNGADLSPELLAGLQIFSVYNVNPAPLLSNCRLSGSFWHCQGDLYLPAGMRFGVDQLV
jgi:CRISPR-associated protein Csc1